MPVLSEKRGTISGSGRCANTPRTLTHLVDRTDRQDEMKATLEQRLANILTSVDMGYSTPCLLSSLTKTRKGYTQIKVRQARRYTHRVVYELRVGPVPEGMDLDHLCRVKHCANPDHLEPVTHRVNVLRGESPSAINARKTECPRCGGEFTRDTRGYRICRPCHRAWKPRVSL